jgi:hypothetical protein
VHRLRLPCGVSVRKYVSISGFAPEFQSRCGLVAVLVGEVGPPPAHFKIIPQSIGRFLKTLFHEKIKVFISPIIFCVTLVW